MKLRQHRSNYCITLSLKEIEEETYLKTLNTLATKKWDSLKGEQHLTKRAKSTAYLMQKWFEQHLITAAIEEIRGGNG